jgi:hypothetical protein
MKDGFPVSVAELLAAGQRPHPSEAVAIVLDVCRQVMRKATGPSVLPPISTAALFLDRSGAVAVAGGVPVEDEQTVPLLGRLLLQMLPAPGTPGGPLVPSRLRRLAARAASGESPRLTVGRLAAALRPFAPEYPSAAIRALFDRWRSDGWRANSAPVLTVGEAAPVDAPVFSRRTHFVPRTRTGRRSAVAALVGALLMLIGAGATYWLNADQALPPLPLSPSILIKDPPPPRDVWELLPDPTGLAVQSGVQSPLSAEGTAGPTKRSPAAGPGDKASTPDARRKDHHPGSH